MKQQELVGRTIQECWLHHAGHELPEVLRQVIDEKSMLSIEHSQSANGVESFHEVRLVPLLQDQVVAIARKEMQGSITAHSDGPGQGAAFTLELPINPPGGIQ